ncbi:tRNA (adenosine(37)-N6)-threonylcarbamoyltransferase complex ATPase subunit type 1 TsaE [Rhizobiaceae bacterium]|nr:tRNA (adenosine(37)-N6)-threonylcarbamoyltransferase complex ATPase subunit type 1 TsaE [Rhizobiaceae bacterium]
MLTVTLPHEAATIRLGEAVALALTRGDLVALSGPLGAGKSTLARATVRTAISDPNAEVPSPTFTLVQSYEGAGFGHLAHLDLYRLESPDELVELGLDDALQQGVALVEWFERANGEAGEPSLLIELSIDGDGRTATMTGPAAERVERSLAVRAFLNANGYEHAVRHFLTGDASSRSYETITAADGTQTVFMNAPAQPDGPILPAYGVPYSRIARLAEDMNAFAGVTSILRGAGFAAPAIHAADIDDGLLHIEHLGSDTILHADGSPDPERAMASARTLAALHDARLPHEIALPDEWRGATHHALPPYDHAAMHIEAGLFVDWYAPRAFGKPLAEERVVAFRDIWSSLFDRLADKEMTMLLRDFHSPNIVWREDRSGHDRVGLIDVQDAVVGPAAYDVASLAQDARVDISPELEAQIVNAYADARTTPFDREEFDETYAIMAAQRATKVAGIFVRLSQRDGKHSYLTHLPRIERYLTRSLQHPVLTQYRSWMDGMLPT